MKGTYKIYDKDKKEWVELSLVFKGEKGDSASVLAGDGVGSSVSGYNSKAIGKYSTAEGGLDCWFETVNIALSSQDDSIETHIYQYDPDTFDLEAVKWCIDNNCPIRTLVQTETSENGSREYKTTTCISYDEEAKTITFSDKLHTESFKDLDFAFQIALEGESTSYAHGDASHSENCSIAEGIASHSEGNSFAMSEFSHAEGRRTRAYGFGSHTEGDRTLTTPTAPYSHAEGHYTIANGRHAHAEGCSTEANNYYTHAEGYKSKASGNTSHAEGAYTVASGTRSHTEGYLTQATKANTHAEGSNTVASMQNAHAEGYKTEAAGEHSHAEGHTTKATASKSHAEGGETVASGECSHAEGYKTIASGKYSHTSGYNTKASNSYEFACGKYNLSNKDNIFSVGVGTSEARRNAIEIKSDGRILIWDGGQMIDLLDEISILRAEIERLNPDMAN